MANIVFILSFLGRESAARRGTAFRARHVLCEWDATGAREGGARRGFLDEAFDALEQVLDLGKHARRGGGGPLLLPKGVGASEAQVGFFAEGPGNKGFELAVAVGRSAGGPGLVGLVAGATSSGDEERIGVFAVFKRLRERVGDGQVRRPDLLQHGKPLLLAHGFTRDHNREHVFHTRVVGGVVEPGGEGAAGGFSRDISVQVSGEVAAGIDMGHVERDAIGIGGHGRQAGRKGLARGPCRP